MNADAQLGIDGYTQATKLALLNITHDIKRIHVDAIATNNLGTHVSTGPAVEKYFNQWNSLGNHGAQIGQLTQDQMYSFVTSPFANGGLGLSPGYYEDAYQFSAVNYGIGHNGDWNMFLGDKLGSMGETSVLACILGALFLIWTGVGSWRTMIAMTLGAFATAFLFEAGAKFFGADGGAWNPAQYAIPAYKHLLLGGLAFGIVFMATDPVSSPSMASAKWIYGIFCGAIAIVIRVVNPAYPEGVMLAILMGNIFAPLFDYYASRRYRKRSLSRVRAAT